MIEDGHNTLINMEGVATNMKTLSPSDKNKYILHCKARGIMVNNISFKEILKTFIHSIFERFYDSSL